MAFPTTGILDNFNRANEGPPPSTNWTNILNGLKVVSNQCKGNVGSADNISRWNATQFGPDAEAYATVIETADGTGAREIDIYVRADADRNPSYFLSIDPYNETLSLWRKNAAGSAFQIGISRSRNIVNGETYGLEIVGTTLSVYVKPSGGSWTFLFSETDTNITAAGYVGLNVYGTNMIVDDFGGGTVVASRRGQVSWSELEVPFAPRRGRVSWAEIEVPTPGGVPVSAYILLKRRRS